MPPVTPTYTQDPAPATISFAEGTFGNGDFGDGVFGEGEYDDVLYPSYTIDTISTVVYTFD